MTKLSVFVSSSVSSKLTNNDHPPTETLGGSIARRMNRTVQGRSLMTHQEVRAIGASIYCRIAIHMSIVNSYYILFSGIYPNIKHKTQFVDTDF